MPDTTAEVEELVNERVREAKLRLTSSRRRVLRVLIDADRPLTLPDILQVDNQLAQSSVYRNLAELLGAGVVRRIDIGEDHAHYELSDDLTDHHHHLICTGCNDVLDMKFPAAFEEQLNAASADVAARDGFVLEGHRLDLLGRCAKCA